MVMVMFGYKHVEILLQKVAEILVSFWYTTGLITEYSWVCGVLNNCRWN